MGVHAAISAAGASPELPAYVRRDFDTYLRDSLRQSAGQGGFILLVGGSSVGKTRALYEGAREMLPDWWLVRPDSANHIFRLAQRPTARTVVWLDELQYYLSDGHDLASAAQVLVDNRMVLLATLWPDEYLACIAPPQPGQPDLHMTDRQLLGLARVVTVPDTLTVAERNRADWASKSCLG